MKRRESHKLNAIISLMGSLLEFACLGVYLYAEKGYGASGAFTYVLTRVVLIVGAGLLGLVLVFDNHCHTTSQASASIFF
jgi:hypothetical protein